MGGWSQNSVYNPVTGQYETFYGHDNASQAQVQYNTNYANMQMNEANNRLQIDLAEEANQFSHDERVEQNEWNRQQELDTREYNEQMRDEQRAYDSPAAQMQRLIDAGINPNMLGSSGAGSSGGSSPVQGSAPVGASNGAGQIANTSAAEMKAPNLTPMGPQIIQAAEAFLHAAGVVSDSMETSATILAIPETIKNDKQYKQAMVDIQKGALKDLMTTQPYRIGTMQGQAAYNFASAKAQDQAAKLYEENRKYIATKADSYQAESDAKIREIDAAIEDARKRFSLAQELQPSIIALNEANAADANASAALKQDQAKLVASQAAGQDSSNSRADLSSAIDDILKMSQFDGPSKEYIRDYLMEHPKATYKEMMDALDYSMINLQVPEGKFFDFVDGLIDLMPGGSFVKKRYQSGKKMWNRILHN